MEPDALNVACAKATGLLACKACIDRSLAEIFGPDDAFLDPHTNFLARHVLKLAAVGDAR